MASIKFRGLQKNLSRDNSNARSSLSFRSVVLIARLEAQEMNMLRWISGVTRKDQIKNEFIRGSVKVGGLKEKLEEERLR